MKKGFTLIELLVVIAIIGILSSVVLASLNTARSKGKDAAIKSNLANMRPQAEIVYDEAGYYGTVPFPAGVCSGLAGSLFADTKVQAFLVDGGNASSNSGISGAYCVSSQTAWAASIPLVTTPDISWCVDSQGASRPVTPVSGDYGFVGTECKAS